MRELITKCNQCKNGSNACLFEVRIADNAYDICGQECLFKFISDKLKDINELLIFSIRRI